MAKGMRSRTPWSVKMKKPAQPEYVAVPDAWAKRMGNGKMVIPTPQAIKDIVAEVPAGRVLTTSQLRDRLAHHFEADVACPLTTGIFLRIVAEASEEQRQQSGQPLAPWWRVVKDDGSLLEKAPGVEAQLQSQPLQAEGVVPQPTGRSAKLKVALAEAGL